MDIVYETDEAIKKRKKGERSNTVTETQEEIKKRKKGIGSKNHSAIQYNIIEQFILHYRGRYKAIPELSLWINKSEKIPDLSFYEKFEINPVKDIVKMKELPLGVVEILSPTQNLTELVVKSHTYLDAGILSYWLVLPSVESVYVYHKGSRMVFTKNDILKDEKLGIEINLQEVFR